MANKIDTYDVITNRIIEKLEQGTVPWHCPWIGTPNYAVSGSTGKPYSFLNQLLVGDPGEYLTFNQIKKAGGKVKKGSKAHPLVFWRFISKQKTDADGNKLVNEEGEPDMDSYGCLKRYSVFNVLTEVEGLETKYFVLPEHDPLPETDRNSAAEAVASGYLAREGIAFTTGGSRAFYHTAKDSVTVPNFEDFQSAAGYYSTLFHELAHSTGAKSRLNRDMTGGFGSQSYSKEELVAEVSAIAILNRLGIETASTFDNSAAYIENWLSVLKSDKKFIVSAMAQAEHSVSRIFGEE